MPAARHPDLDERRRMVIYSRRLSTSDGGTSGVRGASASAESRLRPGRAGYGSRVQRRLRARWYSIVPARRRTMSVFAAVVVTMVAMLSLAHWSALWWPPIANRPDLARPLRLDRPDSFGTWLGAVMLAMTAGASLLVYQLRRYRSDDYHGHYRLWRIAILICLVASIDSVCGLVAWLGAGLDVLMAQREILAGADWMRLLLVVGGTAFGFRITAELSRNRVAMTCMVLTLGLLELPAAVRWNFLTLQPATAATWLPIVGLVARATMLLAVVTYLRMLYREVRQMEQPLDWRQWMRGWVPGRAVAESTETDRPASSRGRSRTDQSASQSPRRRASKASDRETPAATEPGRSWRSWFGGASRRTSDAADQTSETSSSKESSTTEGSGSSKRKRPPTAANEADSRQRSADQSVSEDTQDDAGTGDESEPKQRRWFWKSRRQSQAETGSEPKGEDRDQAADSPEPAASKRRFAGGLGLRRRNKTADGEAETDADEGTKSKRSDRQQQATEKSTPKAAKRSWWRRGSTTEPADDQAAEAKDAATGSETSEPKRRRFSFGLRSRSEDAAEDADDKDQPASRSSAPRAEARRQGSEGASQQSTGSPSSANRNQGTDAPSAEEDLDPDAIDWDNLNKSERRRMRKLLKRQGKAA